MSQHGELHQGPAVLLLCGDQPSQWALAHRLTETGDLIGIVFSSNERVTSGNRHGGLGRLRRYALAPFNWPFRQAWVRLQDQYRGEYLFPPKVPTWRVPEVNDDLTVEVLTTTCPDLVLVSGTNLLNKRLIGIANDFSGMGTMNLHTGLSPYVRGGPNCTNWCLATGRPWLIGNTTMWIDEGIDSGDIISTECTPMDGNESLLGLHRAVMDHAHDLVCRTVQTVGRGGQHRRPQSSFEDSGDLYYTRDWTATHMWQASRYIQSQYRLDVGSELFSNMREELELVRLSKETR